MTEQEKKTAAFLSLNGKYRSVCYNREHGPMNKKKHNVEMADTRAHFNILQNMFAVWHFMLFLAFVAKLKAEIIGT